MPDPNPSFATYGAESRRDFLKLCAAEGGVPG
ncbi:MAG: twin-arginine translocation signal domain-containing protein [Sphingomonas sp.]|nr:twin-arginine translocation signal domain-containing protein [Sphingomonas sp.]